MPAQRVTLSDPLLLEAGDSVVAGLEAAIPRMLATTELGERPVVTLFWEMYGLSAGETPRISVTAVRERNSFFGRIIRGITGREGVDSLVIVWDEPPVAGNEPESRAITLGLESLSRGVYTLSVAIQLPGQEQVMTRTFVGIRNSR
jgi:hypothetical protein